MFSIEQSNRTPRCSQKFSAAGLPWLKHFRYTYVGKIFVSRLQGKCYLATRPGFCAANLLELEALEFRVLWLKSFTLMGGARHQFVNRK